MATFCVVCNTGVSMIPTMDGKEQLFLVAGVYDGVVIIKDIATGTLWNHITGEAVYGKLAGRRLEISNLLQMNVKEALVLDESIKIAISSRPFVGRRAEPETQDLTLSPLFIQSLGQEDKRRPRLDVGLGIWTEESSRYYPLERLHRSGEAVMDEIDGRKVLIYVEPGNSVPAAIYVESENARIRGNEIRLDNGQVVRSGVLFDRSGKKQRVERPLQVFTRWYGFALTFPASAVFGD